MKILIPMAGEGSRFAKEGYQFPKPLIDVNGKPMIQRVVENLDFDAEYIFLVRTEHIETYKGLLGTLQQITNNRCKIVEVNNLTEGAACTVLLAKEFIDNDEDLLIANSDQIIEYEKPKPKPKPKKKIIYQEVEEDEEEEEIVYVKKNKPKPQESLDKTLYKSSQETLYNRAIEERIRANLSGFYSAMMPREY